MSELPAAAPSMPNVVNQTLPAAQAAIAVALHDISYTLVVRDSNGVIEEPYDPDDVVTETDPHAGVQVDNGAVITATVEHSS